MSIILDALKKVQTAKVAPQEQKPPAGSEGSGMFNPQSHSVSANTTPQKRRVIILSAVAIVILGVVMFVGKGSITPTKTSPQALPNAKPVIENNADDDDSDATEDDKLAAQINQLKANAAEKFVKGEFAQSVEDFKKIITKVADDPEVYNNFGLALKKTGKHADAKQQYMIALTLKPDYAEALNNMAVIEIAESKYNEARERLEAAINVSPDYLDPYLHLAICLEKLGEVTGSINYYKEFLQRSEGRSDLRKIRVQIEGRLARLSEDL